MQMLAGTSLRADPDRHLPSEVSPPLGVCILAARRARMEFRKIRFRRPFLIGRYALNNGYAGYTCIGIASRSPFTRPSFQITRDDESSRQHRSEDIWFFPWTLLEISIAMYILFYEIQRVHGDALYIITTEHQSIDPALSSYAFLDIQSVTEPWMFIWP